MFRIQWFYRNAWLNGDRAPRTIRRFEIGELGVGGFVSITDNIALNIVYWYYDGLGENMIVIMDDTFDGSITLIDCSQSYRILYRILFHDRDQTHTDSRCRRHMQGSGK